jgi:peptidoglycan hydrolase CwlO-like protein|tara:strand:+ start:562 stop:819 length:258 start_codon:yes stop_codon:yes gene_type:complete
MENKCSLEVPLFTIYLAENIMTTNEMITELTDNVKHLQRDVEYLYSKLDKAYEDRIMLRAENERLKKSVKYVETTDEEECLACSA